MALPGQRPTLPNPCYNCSKNETCVAYNMAGQVVPLRELDQALLAAGMYRLFCRNNSTGNLRSTGGGVIDVGDEVIDFVDGTWIIDTRVFTDPAIKRFVFPLLVITGIGLFIGIIKSLFFSK